MPDDPRPRFYLTTAIAYANNQPGLHTLYEVIGADAIARWHRMLGDDTRFLTGTDEHSVNIATRSAEEGAVAARTSSTRRSRSSRRPRTLLAIRPDRFIRTTDPDHVRAAQEIVRRAYANGDIYLGTYEGWYCPNEGFRNATDVLETRPRHDLPEPPRRAAPVADRAELVLPPVGLPGAARAPLRSSTRTSSSPTTGATRCSASSARASRTSRSAGPARGWGIPFPIAENGETAQREDGSWDPEAGTIYVWFDALINYITGAGFPDDPEAFARWWPADLHVIGKDIAPVPHDLLAGDAVERRARGAAPGLGPRLAARRRRRADEQEPRQLPRPGRLRGGVRHRRRALRRAPRGPVRPDAEVSWDGFVRRYNADLANDFGNLVNRTVSMANRYLGGERPAPAAGRRRRRRRLGGRPLERVRTRDRRLPAPRRARRRSGSSSAAANKIVDAEQPWALAKAAKAGDEAAAARLRAVLGDLVEACRLIGLAAAPFLPDDRAAGPRPARATPSRTGRTATAARRSSTSCAGAPTPASRAADRAPSRSSRASKRETASD